MTQNGQNQEGTLLQDKQGWDHYWDKQNKKKRGQLYDVIAEFYRKHIIRPSLNHFIKKHFKPHSEVLHAGCGSGQVDRDIRDYVSITGLDISLTALAIFKNETGGKAKALHGSIFQIPLPDSSIDGVYNLGVMEHFSEEENHRILTEFRRILKPGGKVVLFWPPEFGLSVIFFKILKVVLKVLTGKTYKFHPDEICRLTSRSHGEKMVTQAGLQPAEYYFGPRDVFTYSVVVAKKT
jgi:ubiquinone/menaquinone biosynthesis C-methylase UbiE